MKKYTLILLFIAGSIISTAQELRFGFQFTGTSSWLMNKQVFADGKPQDVVGTSFGRYFGPTVQYKFNDKIGVALEFNFNKINQKYTGSIPTYYSILAHNADSLAELKYNKYDSKISYKSFDMPIMFSFGDKVYFEIGPVLHFRTKVTYTNEWTENSPEYISVYYKDFPFYCVTVDNKDITTGKDINGNDVDLWKKFGFGVAIGVGGNIELPKNFIINLGFRASYVLTDMQGLNGLNYGKENYLPKSDENRFFKNNPLYAGIRLGLIYKLPLK
ncbi:MAG: PorT family protein [Bacteroidales bacterium]|jgi:hypothetical protein|nr:PorT family protein [Bacteroidales bacterium]